MRDHAKELQDAADFIEAHPGGYDIHTSLLREAAAKIERLRAASQWRPIETAPKGGGAEMVTDPAWVEPPTIMLLFAGGVVSMARWEWYYAEGGRGYTDGVAWVEPCSSEMLHLHYGMPLKWLPSPPTQEGDK